MSAAGDLIAGTEFLTGLVLGLAGLVITLSRRGRRLDWAVVWGLGVVAGGVLLGMAEPGRIARVLDRPAWIPFGAVAASAAAAFGLFRARDHPWLGPGMVVTMLGVWVTVPDTEAMALVIGVMAGSLASWWPLRRTRPAAAGSAVLAAAMAWAVLSGGGGRAGSTVGALGALAVLGVFGRIPGRAARGATLPDLAVHLAVVAVWVIMPRIVSSPWAVLGGATAGTALILGAARITRTPASRRLEQVQDSGDDPLPIIGPE